MASKAVGRAIVGAAAAVGAAALLTMPPSTPGWITAPAVAEAARLARCPDLARGCFVGGETCQVSRCFCPRVCDQPWDGTGRLWRSNPSECLC